MKSKRSQAFWAVVSFAVVLAALPFQATFAAEGRTPIWTPTVITTPGKYFVSRNLTAAGSPVIEIAAPDVDIDLNGMEIVQPDPGLPAIFVSGPSDVRIHNGSLLGGLHSVLAVGGERVVLEDLDASSTVDSAFLLVDIQMQAIRRCAIREVPTGPAIRLDGADPKTGVIEHNEITQANGGISATEARSLTIRHNRMRELFFGGGGISASGIALFGGSSALIEENVIQQVEDGGIALSRHVGAKIYNNVINQAVDSGIFLDDLSEDCLIRTNVVTGTLLGNGMLILGDRNHIEDNTTNANAGFGILLGAPSVLNVYRKNVARGNGGGPGPCAIVFTADFCDDGAGNATNGDNFLPFPGM